MAEEEMRACPGCGRQVPVAYMVCPYCGRPAYANPYGPPQTVYGSQPYPPQPQERLGVVKYILYLFSLTVILGIIFYFLWDNDPNPEKRHVAKNCLIIGFVWLVFVVIFSIIAAAVILVV
jgi:ABC-type multidrug transport system permease subunit